MDSKINNLMENGELNVNDELNIEDYGWSNDYAKERFSSDSKLNDAKVVSVTDEIPARVISMYRGRYQVVCSKGETSAFLKGSFLYEKREKNNKHINLDKAEMPVTGDFVFIKYNAIGDSQITYLCPRKTSFSRGDFSGHGAGYVKTIKEQVLASNFDIVCILSSLNKEFNEKRLTRYITSAVQSGAKPVVILTKKDQSDDTMVQVCTAQVMGISPDVPVFAVSAITEEGLENLNQFLLPRKTLVFIGSSGVGKSTLVNAIAGKEIMNTNGIREDDDKGRHTTTHREIIRCKNDVLIMDTPGIRELGMWNATSGIQDVYADINSLITQCRFNNCTHGNEPGCAVQAAIKEGLLSESRWKEYLSLMDETTWVEKKAIINGKKKPIHFK